MTRTSSLKRVSSELPPSIASISSTELSGRKTHSLGLSRIRSMTHRTSSQTNLNTRSINYIPIYGKYLSPWVIPQRNYPLHMVALSVSVHLCARRLTNISISQSLARFVQNILNAPERLLLGH